MRSCFQFEQMTILDHGLSVRSFFIDLRNWVLYGTPLSLPWRMPEWVTHEIVSDVLRNSNDLVTELYQVYHDCGKPMCRTIDEQGRQHFPDHAVASRERWLECSDGSSDSMAVAELIGMDMDVHTLKTAGIQGFSSRPQAILLLITALCEIHSNAQMFGGIDSTGFKIKFKHLDKTGRRIVDALVAQR